MYRYEQQDSHDFMRTLLDALHEDLNRVKERTQDLPEIRSKGPHLVSRLRPIHPDPKIDSGTSS